MELGVRLYKTEVWWAAELSWAQDGITQGIGIFSTQEYIIGKKKKKPLWGCIERPEERQHGL